MNKYLPILQKINEHIIEFNSYLRDEFAVPLIDEQRINDQAYFLDPTGKGWNDCQFPRNPHVGGVYFYMGENVVLKGNINVYIGKASIKSKIGERLYDHFKAHWKVEQTTIRNSKGDIFKVELITSIPFEENSLVFLAPALEEYLIIKLQKDFPLFNIVGNS